EANGRLDTRRSLGWITMTPSAVIAGSAAFGAGFLAHGLPLFSARIAAIGFTLREELLSDLAVTLGARELVDGLAVPIELEPTQAAENGEGRALRRARRGALRG